MRIEGNGAHYLEHEGQVVPLTDEQFIEIASGAITGLFLMQYARDHIQPALLKDPAAKQYAQTLKEWLKHDDIWQGIDQQRKETPDADEPSEIVNDESSLRHLFRVQRRPNEILGQSSIFTLTFDPQNITDVQETDDPQVAKVIQVLDGERLELEVDASKERVLALMAECRRRDEELKKG